MRLAKVLPNLVCCMVLLLTTTVSADTSTANSTANSTATSTPKSAANASLQVGVAEQDITPPTGFPMAGYYHERLAEGTLSALKAKAIVFREGDTAAALVVCDLIGIASDLSREVRQQAAAQTGIPASNIVISATHSHTAPDYMKELVLYLNKEKQEPLRAQYIEKLIRGTVDAIADADAKAQPVSLASGVATQSPVVSFNRRSVMRDGSVQTWQAESNPQRLRAAGPIDPQIGLLAIRDAQDGTTRGILSNFALHCDTVGGAMWSADYPFFIERTLREDLGSEVISVFGTGCCGDINHSNPASSERNKADFIGNAIGQSIRGQLAGLTEIEQTHLAVKAEVVELPLEEATPEQVQRSTQILELVKQGDKVEFLDHVLAYKRLILDQLRHSQPATTTNEHLTWGRSRSLAGIGETLPVDVTVISIGDALAIVTLPGEVFVDLGLAIKQASPFRTTIVVELTNVVETIYIPHRAAYAGGSYEVTNSIVMPGSGEMLVEAAVRLLRQAAIENEKVKSTQADAAVKLQSTSSPVSSREKQVDSQDALDVQQLVEDYQPVEGAVIKRISAPFPASRMAFYRSEYATQAEHIPAGPATLHFQWDKGNKKLLQMWFGEPENGTSLRELLPSLCSIGPEFLRGDEALLNRPIAGDFSTRASAEPEEIAAALQKILRAEWNVPVELKLEESEQEIYIASGNFELSPETEERGFVMLQGALIGTSASVSDAIKHARANSLPRGDLNRLLGWLGRSIGVPVVNEVQQGPEGRLQFTSLLPETSGGQTGQIVSAAVASSFAEQTGLTLRLEKRNVRMLHIELAE